MTQDVIRVSNLGSKAVGYATLVLGFFSIYYLFYFGMPFVAVGWILEVVALLFLSVALVRDWSGTSWIMRILNVFAICATVYLLVVNLSFAHEGFLQMFGQSMQFYDYKN